MLERFIRPPIRPDQLQEPRWARFLFGGTTAAWLWLVVRLYEASVFLPAGWARSPAATGCSETERHPRAPTT